MIRRTKAGVVGIGIVGIAPWAYAQVPTPSTPAPESEVPAATQPLPAAPAAPASAAPAQAPAPAPTPTATQDSASSAATPLEDEDEAKPSSGVGLIIGGWITTGVGALNFATLPVCSADFYPRENRDACVGFTVALGVAGVVIGLPMLIVGYNKRSEYKKWSSRHAVLDHVLHTQVAIQNDSALLTYRGSF
jgi:hypothetical protein